MMTPCTGPGWSMLLDAGVARTCSSYQPLMAYTCLACAAVHGKAQILSNAGPETWVGVDTNPFAPISHQPAPHLMPMYCCPCFPSQSHRATAGQAVRSVLGVTR